MAIDITTSDEDIQRGHDPRELYDRAIDLLCEGSELFQQRKDEQAHQLSRRALQYLLWSFEKDGQGDTLYRMLMAFRSVAASAIATRRTNEGLCAIQTGIAYADLGLKTWIDAPPLLQEKARLEQMLLKSGGVGGAVVISDRWHWPFDD